jgi:hypothetical protein
MNSSGWTGKFGSGITVFAPDGTKVTNENFPFVPFVPFSGGWAAR